MGITLPETLTQRAGDRNLVEWCCDSRNRAAEYKGSWDERPRCLVGVVARRPLRGHVCSRRSADSLLPVRWCGNAAFDFEHMGHRRIPQRSGDLLALPRFSPGGALIASRRPKNPIGWICLAAGLFWMSIVVEASIPGSASYPVTIDALLQWTWVPPVGLLGIYMILLFPDGRLPSRWWRPIA
jgi:hypothetical protein